MSMPPPHVFALLLAASALVGVVVLQWSHRHSTLLRLRAAMGEIPDAAPTQDGFSAGLQWLGSRLPGASDNSLRSALTNAGYFQPAALPVFIVLRLLCTGLAFCAVLFHGGKIQAATVMTALFFAFFCSRIFVVLLKLKAEARQREIRREMPPLVDILLMILNSGVSIDQCLRYVSGLLENTTPLISIVFKRYVADVDSGVPFETAFERLGQRLGVDEGYDLANLIKQALLQGGEIMASLEHLGAELADKRVATAREQIGRKSVLLTMVMLAFFMPVLLIALGGPAVSHITDTLRTVRQHLHNRGEK